tara:strand:- start:473 stop:691 length:219 start_codon:yes stop_codon:yes gene_type:complete
LLELVLVVLVIYQRMLVLAQDLGIIQEVEQHLELQQTQLNGKQVVEEKVDQIVPTLLLEMVVMVTKVDLVVV